MTCCLFSISFKVIRVFVDFVVFIFADDGVIEIRNRLFPKIRTNNVTKA